MPENNTLHLCDYCKHISDEIRGCGCIDAGGIYNDCEVIDAELYYAGLPEMVLFRANPDLTDAYVPSCPYFENVTVYKDYMHSDEWSKKRRERIEFDGYKCKLCGSAKNLNVHHITYDHLGFEPLDDLVTVCASCHEKLHSEDLSNA